MISFCGWSGYYALAQRFAVMGTTMWGDKQNVSSGTNQSQLGHRLADGLSLIRLEREQSTSAPSPRLKTILPYPPTI